MGLVNSYGYGPSDQALWHTAESTPLTTVRLLHLRSVYEPAGCGHVLARKRRCQPLQLPGTTRARIGQVYRKATWSKAHYASGKTVLNTIGVPCQTPAEWR